MYLFCAFIILFQIGMVLRKYLVSLGLYRFGSETYGYEINGVTYYSKVGVLDDDGKQAVTGLF